MSNDSTLTAGIDVGKDKLDIAVHGQTNTFIVPNSRTGWKRLAADFATIGVGRVGIEATGGYERGVIRHLRAAGFKIVLLQPLQVKAYARMHLRRAKNDRLDAAIIAACAHALDARADQPDPRLEALTDQLTFVEQVESDIARNKTRLEHIHIPRLRLAVTQSMARLKKLLNGELRRIEAALRAHDDLALRLDLVLSVPGIGDRTALAIVVLLPEVGQLTREQVAALAGLAPFDDDSARRTGQRHIAGGRSRLRRSLFAAAQPAASFWNPACMALYQRLKKAGKSHKAALIACARKLLIFANTVVARGTPWQDRPAQP